MYKIDGDDPDHRWWKKAQRRAMRRHRRAVALRRVARAPLAILRFLVAPRSPQVVGAVAMLAVLGALVWFHRGTIFHYRTPADAHAATETTTVRNTPGRPFAGTPAEDYSEGAKGIVAPPARPVGDWTTAQVSAGLTAVRRALILGHLDNRMLIHHDPTALLGVLSPAVRDQVRKAVTHDHGYTVQLDRGVRLARAAPRVHGTLSVRLEHDNDRPVLVFTSNYVWVYAFEDAPDPVVMHDRIQWRIYRPGDVQERDRGLRPDQWKYYLYGMDCAAAEKGLVKPRPAIDPSADPVRGAADDPDSYYRPDHTIDITESCR